MNRSFYSNLAAAGLRMPIGVDLVLHEQPDPETILCDGDRLGAVVQLAAERYRTPLAFPLMDLRLEKSDLLEFAGIAPQSVDSYHFETAPSIDFIQELRATARRPFSERIRANQRAVRYIAERTNLLPVGMLIGPFSLMTKLVADPITPVALAGRGVSALDDDSVLLAERCLQLAQCTVERSAIAQMEAGAKAVIVCEPAANKVYLSPRQSSSGIFERYVMQANRMLRDLLASRGVDLIFHNCGEVVTDFIRQFAHDLHPAILSLGSSRKLWEDAAVVPDDVVLFGNLPTKSFYSDSTMPIEEVRRRTVELSEQMQACGHPHILGSECDVLHVPEAADTIRHKVAAMLGAAS